jgi:GDP-L-fucose synthase
MTITKNEQEFMSKVLVTGGHGLIGSILEADVKVGKEFDLRIPEESNRLIKTYKPTHVIHCAAKVGGIGGNMSAMGEYFYDNLMINTNIIESCRLHNVKKMIVFLSTCVFPVDVEYPLTEDKIHLGPSHETNYGYGYSKRMAEVQIRAYNQQYGTNYFAVIPCNMYGPNDNYNLENTHVIPALIHKTYLAKINNTDLNVWGSGNPLREFIYAKDVADIIKLLMNKYNGTSPIILSTSNEVSIREVVDIICDIMDFKNNVIFDISKPDGQFRKPSDNSYLKSIIGDYEFTTLRVGLEETVKHFIKNYNTIRL